MRWGSWRWEGKGAGRWAPSQGGLALCHFWEQNSEGGENSKFKPRILCRKEIDLSGWNIF